MATLAGLRAPEPVATVNPAAFVGIASDGRPLDSLLYSSTVTARNLYADPVLQMESGRRQVSMLARTMVADAGRGAAQVTITATPLAGYVRMVSPPCCKDCAVLAGKWFKHNEGFERHPNCDCTHVPRVGANIPDGYVSDIPTDQITNLSDGERKALDGGADLSRVVNASRKGRGMSTTVGTGRRPRGARLTPDGIYRIASNRDEALTLLGRYGYLRTS